METIYYRILAVSLAMLVSSFLSVRVLATGSSNAAPKTSYYVSQSTGNDQHDGLAPKWDGKHGPWKSLTKASSLTYGAGNKILLKSGDVWHDGLYLKGYGNDTSPAVVSCYGTGARPIIDRQDPSMASNKHGINLDGNAHGWKIMNLEITNARYGVLARISERGHSYLWLENLYIHGCKHGGPFNREDGDQNDQQIGVRMDGPLTGKATITKCTFADNFVGATISTPCNVIDNMFKHMEWTAMWYVASGGGLIRGNKFMHNCDQHVWCGVSAIGSSGSDWIVEYNEFGETQRQPNTVDGEDFDFEAGCHNVTMRYNLFHDTAGPASMIYSGAGGNAPNTQISIHDNVLYNNAIRTEMGSYNMALLISGNKHTGTVSNNRIYHRPEVPAIAGSHCPGLDRTGNVESILENENLGKNEALTAKVSVSSQRADAKKINDGDGATAWSGTSASKQWVQLSFAKPINLDTFVVEQAPGSSINNFVLQYWTGSAWKDIFTSWSAMGSKRFMPTWRVTASKVRLCINSTESGLPAITEFMAYDSTQAGVK